ncbi:hypothetical protein EDC01DRAFT_632064 [Geopyxis carbonaria]|nr:hypothetical protein EDC01DRAFT_632064 [Geopyxis carbonaria]
MSSVTTTTTIASTAPDELADAFELVPVPDEPNSFELTRIMPVSDEPDAFELTPVLEEPNAFELTRIRTSSTSSSSSYAQQTATAMSSATTTATIATTEPEEPADVFDPAEPDDPDAIELAPILPRSASSESISPDSAPGADLELGLPHPQPPLYINPPDYTTPPPPAYEMPKLVLHTCALPPAPVPSVGPALRKLLLSALWRFMLLFVPAMAIVCIVSWAQGKHAYEREGPFEGPADGLR